MKTEIRNRCGVSRRGFVISYLHPRVKPRGFDEAVALPDGEHLAEGSVAGIGLGGLDHLEGEVLGEVVVEGLVLGLAAHVGDGGVDLQELLAEKFGLVFQGVVGHEESKINNVFALG